MGSVSQKKTKQLISLEKEIDGLIKELESFNENIKRKYKVLSQITHDGWISLMDPEEQAEYLGMVEKLNEKMWDANKLRGMPGR